MTDKAKLAEYVKVLEEIKQRKTYVRMEDFQPYPKQWEFFNAGAFRERMLCAGNQVGKSEAGAYEMACHLTGDYPERWEGRRYDRSVTAWAAGETGNVVRDVQQSKLFGKPGVPEMFGTGMIPKHLIVGAPSTARGVTDLFDTVHVRHKSGGISELKFKSYEQGRKKFQGTPVDVIWLDEEPDAEVYDECYARGNATGGMMYVTFTPLQGRTELVNRFFRNDQPKFRKLIRIRYSDCPFMTPDKVESNLAGTPGWQRNARMDGEPVQGQGLVFSQPRDAISEPRIQFVPMEWSKLWAIDFGISEEHQFAAVLLLWDKDTDVIHVHDCFKSASGSPLEHAVRMKHIGVMVPVAWPHDGTKGMIGGDGMKATQTLAGMYRAQGLRMCAEHAQFQGGGYSTEAGVLEMEQRFKSGRLKVASHLEEWFAEYGEYHRKDGLIVKKRDDLLSATRIGIMAKRSASPVQLGARKPDARMNGGVILPDDPWQS